MSIISGRKTFTFGLYSILFFLVIYCLLFSIGFDERSQNKIGKVTASCEMNDDGLIRQPTNTITGLAMCLPGLLILWKWDEQSEKLPFENNKSEVFLYSGSVLFVGFGTALAHGSMMKLGSRLDTAAMIIWILIPITWAIIRVLNQSEKLRIQLWIGLSIIITSYTLFSDNFGIIDFYFLVIPIWIILEIIAHFLNRGSINKWTMKSIYFFIIAYISRTIGENNSAFCNPDSLWQWHGVWHIFCTYVIWCTWMHICNIKAVKE